MSKKNYRIEISFNERVEGDRHICVMGDNHNGQSGYCYGFDSREELINHLRKEYKGIKENDIELIDKTDLKISIGEILGCSLMAWC